MAVSSRLCYHTTGHTHCVCYRRTIFRSGVHKVKKDQEWHLSKSVPLTFVVAIFIQTASLVWYVSSMDNTIRNNEKELMRQDVRIQSLEGVVQTQALTLARIDENIKSIRNMMEAVQRARDQR